MFSFFISAFSPALDAGTVELPFDSFVGLFWSLRNKREDVSSEFLLPKDDGELICFDTTPNFFNAENVMFGIVNSFATSLVVFSPWCANGVFSIVRINKKCSKYSNKMQSFVRSTD